MAKTVEALASRGMGMHFRYPDSVLCRGIAEHGPDRLPDEGGSMTQSVPGQGMAFQSRKRGTRANVVPTVLADRCVQATRGTTCFQYFAPFNSTQSHHVSALHRSTRLGQNTQCKPVILSLRRIPAAASRAQRNSVSTSAAGRIIPSRVNPARSSAGCSARFAASVCASTRFVSVSVSSLSTRRCCAIAPTPWPRAVRLSQIPIIGLDDSGFGPQ